VKPVDDERATKRHRYDDPDSSLSHAPSEGAGGELNDFCR
jgi:hypothetical protein